MAEAYVLSAEKRERAGKGAARATRRSGRVPAVIYGDKKDTVMISVEPVELAKFIKTGGFFSHLVELDAGGEKYRVLARDIQLDPVTDRPMHIDFLRVTKGSRIAVHVPIHYTNEAASPGIKRGGVLNIVRHDVELTVSPEAIPEYLEVDLTGIEIGDSIHISSITLPEGVRPTIDDRDFTLATVAAPSAVKSAGTEDEVEGEEGEDEAKEEGGEA
jgi:large subunit ribosomal protein L25